MIGHLPEETLMCECGAGTFLISRSRKEGWDGTFDERWKPFDYVYDFKCVRCGRHKRLE